MTTSEPDNELPSAVAKITAAMSTFAGPWALCGGWAVEAWTGRSSREHGDVDVAMFIDDQQALYEHFARDWQMVAHDPNVAGNTSQAWDGRTLDMPAHIHGRLDAGEPLPDNLDEPGSSRFDLDIQLSGRSADGWVLSQEPRISMPLDEAIQMSPWGVPTAVPEVLLFYKADDLRLRDKIDFLALRPQLTNEQCDWLRDALTRFGHPWLRRLPA